MDGFNVAYNMNERFNVPNNMDEWMISHIIVWQCVGEKFKF
jgi:hypothetical protein